MGPGKRMGSKIGPSHTGMKRSQEKVEESTTILGRNNQKGRTREIPSKPAKESVSRRKEQWNNARIKSWPLGLITCKSS